MKKVNNKNARYIYGYQVLREYYNYHSDDTFELELTIKISESQQIGFDLNKLVQLFESFYIADCSSAHVDLKYPTVKLFLYSKYYVPF